MTHETTTRKKYSKRAWRDNKMFQRCNNDEALELDRASTKRNTTASRDCRVFAASLINAMREAHIGTTSPTIHRVTNGIQIINDMTPVPMCIPPKKFSLRVLLLEKGNHVGEIRVACDAGKRHLGPGQHLIRTFQIPLQRGLIPREAGLAHR